MKKDSNGNVFSYLSSFVRYKLPRNSQKGVFWLEEEKQKEVSLVAKGKYEYWITPVGLTLVEGWARDGLTDEQIAHNMGIAYSTLRKWRDTYEALSAALKKGKEVVDFEVENALFKNAIGGDTTAQIFWLKNRRPGKWRDKQNIEVSRPIDDTIKELEAFFDE